MNKFCTICENILYPNFDSDLLSFKCVSCHITYDTHADDTLRYEKVNENNIIIFEKIINRADEDPAGIKSYVDCIKPSCDGKIVKQVRIGDDLKLFNICIKCKTQWLN